MDSGSSLLLKQAFAPGSRVVSDYLVNAGLMPFLEALDSTWVGLRVYYVPLVITVFLPPGVAREVKENNLVVAAVLSGNRNLRGTSTHLSKQITWFLALTIGGWPTPYQVRLIAI